LIEGLILLMGESKGLMAPNVAVSLNQECLNKKLRATMTHWRCG